MTQSSPRLTTLPAWQKLRLHYEQISGLHMRDLFAREPDRFTNFSIGWEDFFLDYSKNQITSETMELLVELARLV